MSRYLIAAALCLLTASAGAQVIKCTVDGQTVYTNQGCSNGTRGERVEMYNSAGTVSPDRRTNETPAPARATAPAASSRQACSAMNKYISSLDAMARKPQSASNQAWIKSEKAKTQMHNAQC